MRIKVAPLLIENRRTLAFRQTRIWNLGMPSLGRGPEYDYESWPEAQSASAHQSAQPIRKSLLGEIRESQIADEIGR